MEKLEENFDNSIKTMDITPIISMINHLLEHQMFKHRHKLLQSIKEDIEKNKFCSVRNYDLVSSILSHSTMG